MKKKCGYCGHEAEVPEASDTSALADQLDTVVDVVRDHMTDVRYQVDVVKQNSDALIDGIRAHLRTIEHKLSLDAESVATMTALRNACDAMRCALYMAQGAVTSTDAKGQQR